MFRLQMKSERKYKDKNLFIFIPTLINFVLVDDILCKYYFLLLLLLLLLLMIIIIIIIIIIILRLCFFVKLP